MTDDRILESAGIPVPLSVPPEKPKFWSRRRIIIVIATVVLAILASCACVGFFVWRSVSAELQTQAELDPLTKAAYPGYRVVDSTRFGPILQSESLPALRVDVRYFEAGAKAPWTGQLMEAASTKWAVNDTFFRHGRGMKPDPRNGMNYDIEGFVRAYQPLRPGANSVVSGVWLEEAPAGEMESYVVLVARRNRGEAMWPDYVAYFVRDPETGDWNGFPFEPVVVENWRR